MEAVSLSDDGAWLYRQYDESLFGMLEIAKPEPLLRAFTKRKAEFLAVYDERLTVAARKVHARAAQFFSGSGLDICNIATRIVPAGR